MRLLLNHLHPQNGYVIQQLGTGGLSLRLLGAILLFIPGIVAVDLYYRRTQQNVSLSRVQRYVYAGLLSLVSLGLLYLLTPFYFTAINSYIPDLFSRYGIVTDKQLLNTSFPTKIVVYTLHFSLTVLLAILFSIGSNIRSDRSRDRRDPWQYAFGVVPSDGEQLEVVMNDGRIIQGEYNVEAWDSAKRELYLDNPDEIEYNDDMSNVSQRVSLGRSILLQSSAISHIIFTEPDPQSEYSFDVAEFEEYYKTTTSILNEISNNQTSLSDDQWKEDVDKTDD